MGRSVRGLLLQPADFPGGVVVDDRVSVEFFQDVPVAPARQIAGGRVALHSF